MKYFNTLKTSIFFVLIGCLFMLPLACEEDEEETGSIFGVVKDERQNGLQGVEVTLDPGGKTTITGSDGRYEFIDLKLQQYTIKAEKSGYQSNVKTINVTATQAERCDIPIKDGTGYLYIERKELNFGKSNDLMAFPISNRGQVEISWKIDNSYDWIKRVEPSSGTIRAGGSTSVSVTIDRSQLQSGKTKENSLVVTSDSGADYIIIKATGDDGKGSGTDPGGSNQPNLSAGLMAHYTFDNQNADDVTRNENHANIVNGSSFYEETPSGNGKAIFLNGSKNQFVNIPINFFKGLTSYSFSFWVKDFGPGVLVAAVSSSDLSSCYPRLMAQQDGMFCFYTSRYTSGGQPYSYAYNVIQDGKWHMISIVFNYINSEAETKLYIDGRLKSTKTSSCYASEVPQIQIGGNCNGLYNSNSSSMLVDEVRFYNRCLTDSDIKYLYQQELE